MRMHPYRRPITSLTTLATSSHAGNNNQHQSLMFNLTRLDDISISIDVPESQHNFAMQHLKYFLREGSQLHLQSVIKYGGIDIMLRFIMYSKTLPHSNRLSQDASGTLNLLRKRYALDVLLRLLQINTPESQQKGRALAKDQEFLNYLLELCLLEDTSISASMLLSYLTRHHDCFLDFAKAENFPSLLAKASKGQLVNFCNILLPLYKVKFSTQDSNQAILLKIPYFLEYLVDMACDSSNPLQYTVLGALYTILKGKHRAEVCQVLAKVSFGKKLLQIFTHEIQNGHRCEENCEDDCPIMRIGKNIISMALKCLHRFVEGTPFKYSLLSKDELQLVQDINSKLEEQYQDADCERISKEHVDQNLHVLSYVCYLIVTNQTHFGEFSCLMALLKVLKSFLHGASPCFQMFIAKKGLLDCLILLMSRKNDPRQLAVIFDVIAELIRFNPILFKILSHSLIKRHKFDLFFEKMENVKNVANCTKLMQSLILTCNYAFNRHESSDDTLCFLGQLIQSYKIEYMKILLQIISIRANTGPMIETIMKVLVTENKRNHLSQVLEALANKCATDHSGCGLFLSFKDAFWKWQKNMELQKVISDTDISTGDWNKTVEVLFAEDGQKNSLYYWYLQDSNKFHSISELDETNEQSDPPDANSSRCMDFYNNYFYAVFIEFLKQEHQNLVNRRK